MSKKKIVVFSGSGISQESNIETFRDVVDGLWYNHKVEDVATLDGWKRDREKVLGFYNDRRSQLPNVEPNDAHKGLVCLEEEYDVIHVTQNVDNLFERAGATNIIHLHGELTKARSCMNPLAKPIDISYNNISIGDKASDGSQLRPHIVFFAEFPFGVKEAYTAIDEADILLIIGTSLQITYTVTMLSSVNPKCKIYYIDPSPMTYLDNYGLKIEYIKEKAVKGVTELVNKLLNKK